MKRRKKAVQRSEYQAPNGELWGVEEFKQLASEFGIKEKDLPEFHGLAENFPVPWRITRMLFGVNPLFPTTKSDADFLRTFSRAEIAAEIGTAEDQIQCQLDMLTMAWAKHERQRPETPAAPAAPEPPAPKEAPKIAAVPPPAQPVDSPLAPQEASLIQGSGFSMEIFELRGRSVPQQHAEMKWFASRLLELKKMFEEPMAKSLARQAIINEMTMRRLDDEISITPVKAGSFWSLQESKSKIEEVYQKQWAQLEEICPYIRAVGSKVTFAGVVSEIIEAYKQYKANSKSEMIDGLFTAFEIQVEHRQSVQAEARYRPGLIAAVNEAKAALWDPNFRRKLPDSQLAMLDEGYREAQRQLNEKKGIALTDLELDGPGGEYPPLYAPPSDEELVQPEGNIPIEEPQK